MPLTAGATLVLPLPEGAAREPDEALPAVAVPSLPGARIAAGRGYRSGDLTLRALCAAAPAKGWAPGVEEIVLDRAGQITREALGGEVTSFTTGEQAAAGPGFEQHFEGLVRHGSEKLAVRGRHWLGFAGDPREAIVCTVVCTEPRPDPAPAGRCEALIAAVTPAGAWAEAPPPSILARTLLLAAERPYAAAGLLLAASLAAAALIIARRPRPRPF